MTTEARALELIDRVRSRPAAFKDAQVTMAHGAGGKASRTLVEGLLAPALGVATLDDAAYLRRLDGAGQGAQVPALPAPERETVDDLALTTDSFVVRPIRFPGGSIGKLAVNGTVNDLAVSGARPLALTLSLVLEEGLAADDLRAEVEAIAAAAAAADVQVVAGDTKVVERGRCDSMYVTTTGLGRVDPRASLDARSVRPGDRVVVSGSVGEHGTAVMLARGEFELDAPVESDTRALWPAVDALLDAVGPSLRVMRDATRGGIATVLNELARPADVGVVVHEARIPVRPPVVGACEILGIDPMYVANEGVFVAIVAPDVADRAVAALREVEGCEEAAEVGEVRDEPQAMVLLQTAFGGRRVLDLLVGDPLPRIC